MADAGRARAKRLYGHEAIVERLRLWLDGIAGAAV
jgi:hypothetical protein